MTVATVLFDAGNTLVELDFEIIAAEFANEGVEIAADDLRRAAGEGRGILDRFLAEMAGSTEAPDTLGFSFDVICDGVGVSDTAVRPRVLARIAPGIYNLWNVPLPGARETLDALKSRGFRLGVVSNSNGTVARVLSEADVAEPLEVIIDSGDVGVEKPDPAIFALAMEALDADPATTVYVGDLPCVDVAGAMAAEIRPILIDPWDAFPDVKVERIAALGELPDLL